MAIGFFMAMTTVALYHLEKVKERTFGFVILVLGANLGAYMMSPTFSVEFMFTLGAWFVFGITVWGLAKLWIRKSEAERKARQQRGSEILELTVDDARRQVELLITEGRLRADRLAAGTMTLVFPLPSLVHEIFDRYESIAVVGGASAFGSGRCWCLENQKRIPESWTSVGFTGAGSPAGR